jgi:hypothetical protein
MKQQESLQQQIARMISQAPPPMNQMAEVARHNLEMWYRMQESMLSAFMGPRHEAKDDAGEERSDTASSPAETPSGEPGTSR